VSLNPNANLKDARQERGIEPCTAIRRRRYMFPA